jgi:uncharacterized membrane protein YhaH (DUF805 family)
MAEWFVQVGGKQYGPFDSAKLVKLAAARKLNPDDLVKKGRDGEWKPASNVRRLFDAETQAEFDASKSNAPQQSPSKQGSSKQRRSAKQRGSSRSSKPAAADRSRRRRKAKPPPAEPLFDLSEDIAVAPAEENPYQSPQALPMTSTGFEPGRMGTTTAARDTGWNLFNSEGRVGRQMYWIVSLVTSAVLFGSLFLFVMIVVAAGNNSAIMLFGGICELCVFIACLWASLAVQAKRWHDRNKSSLWILMNFVPYIGGLWVFVELGFLRGTAGSNAYGPDPT